jgi:hypothetical protein
MTPPTTASKADHVPSTGTTPPVRVSKLTAVFAGRVLVSVSVVQLEPGLFASKSWESNVHGDP